MNIVPKPKNTDATKESNSSFGKLFFFLLLVASVDVVSW